MKKKDTILIFQEPDLYFFPFYKDITFSPFGIPERSFRYLIYKALYIFRIPYCSLFWGKWKNHIRTARRVIIFDYGYQAGMETYIHKINPNCRVYLFFWNIITKEQKNHLLFTDKASIYSTDKGCCQAYNFKYNHIFYPKAFYQPYFPQYQNKIFFIGHDKGRGAYIQKLCDFFQKCGLICDIHILSNSKNKVYRAALSDILTDKHLSYSEYCKNIKHCGILLDINQRGQTALTMRVLESIYFSKKLITNNKDIISYNFYNENNIFLLPDKINRTTVDQLKVFLKKPFLPYSEEVLNFYDFEHWKKQFL